MKIKLGRILKILSTILIAVGIGYLFLFVQSKNRSLLDIFDKPSYYTQQNYHLLFLAGIAAVAFSVLGSFFSWSPKIDPEDEVLMNAGYTSAQNIATWLKDSTANEESRQYTVNTSEPTEVSGATTVLDSEPAAAETTVIDAPAKASAATTVLDNEPAAAETTVIDAPAEVSGAATVLDNEPASTETTVMQEPEAAAVPDSAPAAAETTVISADYEDEWAADTLLMHTDGKGKETDA